MGGEEQIGFAGERDEHGGGERGGGRWGRGVEAGDAERERLCRSVRNYRYLLPQSLRNLELAYMRARPSQTMEDLKMERRWLEENCRAKVEAWEGECAKLEEFVDKGGFYQPMTLQEREEIVKAFGFCECCVHVRVRVLRRGCGS